MAGHAFAAGEQLTADTVNLYLATQYQYASDSSPHTPTGLTSGIMQDFTGMLSVNITVNATGILLVRWGAEGQNTASATATCRVGIALAGANTQAGSNNLSCCCNSGTGATFTSASRMHIYTGLNPGVTTVKTQAYPSSGTTVTIDNQFLYVQNWL